MPDVLYKTPAAQVSAVNAFVANLYGDPPGTGEISLNAYVNGEDNQTATFSLANGNFSQGQADTLIAYLAGVSGCASSEYASGVGTNFESEALRLWNLKIVDPVGP